MQSISNVAQLVFFSHFQEKNYITSGFDFEVGNSYQMMVLFFIMGLQIAFCKMSRHLQSERLFTSILFTFECLAFPMNQAVGGNCFAGQCFILDI